ncbi:hypothetical protein ABPG75_008826 [Micractinium tetrahymenae]
MCVQMLTESQQQQQAAPRVALGLGLRPVGGLQRTPAAPQQQPALRRRLQARPLVVAAASSGKDAAAAAAAAAPAPSSGHGHGGGRHAFLHDFCMCLPYGALVAVGGLLARLFGWGQPAVVMMVVGALQLALSSLSLKVWRQNKSAAPFTLLEAGLAGWLAYYAWRAVQQRVAPVFMAGLLGLSAAMALFLVYNVAAGGNPPRRGTHAAAAAALPADPSPAPTS